MYRQSEKHLSSQSVVKVRGNAGERRSWAPKNCWRAFPGPIAVNGTSRLRRALTADSRAPIFSEFPGPQIYTLTTAHNSLNCGLLTAEICWRVWGNPANFNGFRVLALLLQRRRSTEVNQTLHYVRPSPGLIHCIYYIYTFGSSCRLTEFCHVQNSLCIHLLTIAQVCRAISSQLRHILTIGKKILNSNISSTRPVHNMVNFGPLAAEILWRVWGTPANFNGFCVLAALLHSTLVESVSQTLRR